MSSALNVYPIYLRRLNEKRTVIIGGNEEAEGKVRDFLDREAKLTVISPKLNSNLQKWADKGRFEWISREYRYGDLAGAFVVIVAEYEGDVNERAYQEAEERNLLINVMDDIPHANFAFGSIVKQGPLTISISTGGAAPALAVRLRQRFEQEFGEEYGHFLEFMQSLRKPMSRHHKSFQVRRKIWYELIDSDILTLFRENRKKDAYKKASEIAGEKVVNDALGNGSEEKRVGLIEKLFGKLPLVRN
ncbi:precorrin-2 dehydrogenase/sirohydrochlorin ferrochelatase family protein [Gracilimonas mengyeensis]|uniref:precorrin-2 dehydrogenase n=1 Tax=Gracilimonas mengyeensis TaxID=1302730 RepID=A0A521F634_9BACT|nr:bifunctional precorrin-2 dehydrogenase/sirohydrochlorin ferrochelatase [Gracilimonas mengyeensis]SMO91642.1 precorrin-2 dehydrogenase / sirohydrochlorin ferrochelatase [Gracilimonas mengyeensis]